MNASENHDPNAIQMVSFTEWIWDAWKERALKPLRFPSFFASVLRPSIKSSSPAMWKHCSAWLTVEPIQAVGFASSSSWTRFVSFSHILVIIMNYNELNPYGERYPQRCGEVSTKDPYKFFNVVHQNVSVPSLVFSRWDLLGIFATSGDRKPQTYSSIYMMMEMQGMFDDACASILSSAAVRMCGKMSIWRSSHQRQGQWHCSWCFATFD